MITDKEAESLKKEIIKHIEKTFPEDTKDSAIVQINAMDAEHLENFLEKNRLIKSAKENEDGETEESEEKNKCVFCAISDRRINSVKLDENDDAVAVLEINPISRGHAIVIPKTHSNSAGKEALAMAKKISKKIEEKFSPKNVEIGKSVMFGHEIINILPVYGKEDFNSERGHASIEDLEQTREDLEKEEGKKKTKEGLIETEPKTEVLNNFLWLPKRIP